MQRGAFCRGGRCSFYRNCLVSEHTLQAQLFQLFLCLPIVWWDESKDSVTAARDGFGTPTLCVSLMVSERRPSCQCGFPMEHPRPPKNVPSRNAAQFLGWNCFL